MQVVGNLMNCFTRLYYFLFVFFNRLNLLILRMQHFAVSLCYWQEFVYRTTSTWQCPCLKWKKTSRELQTEMLLDKRNFTSGKILVNKCVLNNNCVNFSIVHFEDWLLLFKDKSYESTRSISKIEIILFFLNFSSFVRP